MSHDWKRMVLGVVMLSAPSAAGRAQAPAPPTPPAEEVSVRFVAVDAQHRAPEALAPGDLKVEYDGRARKVLALRRLDGERLSLVIALDTSASQERVLAETRPAADAFVREVMRPGVDEVGVAAFSGEAVLEQYLTSDPAKVRAAIGRVRFEPPEGYVGGGVIVAGDPRAIRTGSTAVWEAVSAISNDVLAREPREVRRALVLITDGVDTSSRVKLDEAVREALRAEAVVYAIGIADEKNFDGVDKNSLRRLAERTGGRAFFPKKAGELPGVFAQIKSELLSPYVVTFEAAGVRRDGSLRKVKLELVNEGLRRRGVKLAHPQGHLAR